MTMIGNLNARKALKYSLLPALLPRFRSLLSSGFGYISFFIAQIYGTARLLPPGHPYLHAANMGRFGVGHVIIEAARHLKLRKENLDQIIIFAVMLIGLLLLLAQFIIMGLALFVHAAHAGMPNNFAEFFLTPDPGFDPVLHDVAFVLLDRVFGVPDFFTSVGGAPTCVAENTLCFPWLYSPADQAANVGDGAFPAPFHLGLRAMMQIYSIGLLVVAVLILLYFIVTVILETAQSGTPFGRRFNHVWAPIRLVVALGLLIPVANGLNSAQYIVLYAAKWGSGFATNGWNLFMDTALSNDDDTLAGRRQDMIATPNAPALTNLLEWSTAMITCWYMEQMGNQFGGVERPVQPWLTRRSPDAPSRIPLEDVDYEEALEFYEVNGKPGDISITFGYCLENPEPGAGASERSTPCPDGDIDNPAFPEYAGYVAPICGEVIVPVTNNTEPGAQLIQELYFELFKAIALNTGGPALDLDQWGWDIALCLATSGEECIGAGGALITPTITEIQNLINEYQLEVEAIIAAGVDLQNTTGDWTEILGELGWGGAAIWYNKIAQLNGTIISAVKGSVPYPAKYPEAMEYTKTYRMKHEMDASGRNVYNPVLANGKAITFSPAFLEKKANAEWFAYNLWTHVYEQPSGNVFTDAAKSLFGPQGVFNIQKNPTVHPLAQLVGIGKGLVTASIAGLGGSMGGTVGGGIFAFLGASGASSFALVGSDIVFTIAMTGLTLGFVLFYIVPFLPFIYFFFAVGGWVKGIFEAMVGVPLWALAHIRIDGDGLPGDAAMGGYYLILEIFLRPILIVFGLLASVLLFAAQVRILHEVWSLVVSNVSGFDPVNAVAAGGPAPEETGGIANMTDAVSNFFFTIIYTIVVYMCATSSFKLIDLIPNHLLRWMGANVQTFNEQRDDPTENLVRNTSYGGSLIQQNLGEAKQSITSAAQSMNARNAK